MISCCHLFQRAATTSLKSSRMGGQAWTPSTRGFAGSLSGVSTNELLIQNMSLKDEEKDELQNKGRLMKSLLPLLLPIATTTTTMQATSIAGTSTNSISSLIGSIDDDDDECDENDYASIVSDGIWNMNRNARKPKKANKGARPCSRAARRAKKAKIGKRKR